MAQIKKIVIATDSFKGCLSAREVALAVEEGIKQSFPACEVLRCPIADGGEGMLDIWVSALNGTYVQLQAHNPLMEQVTTRYGISGDGRTALIEMAAISGLPLVPIEKRNPMHTTTFGTGELIKDALHRGCREFVIGIGGSATNDAGLGMLQALGYRFLDSDHQELGVGGEIMEHVAYIDTSFILPELKDARFTIACDVDNPFDGPNGAAYVYASQKGADANMVRQLDEGMRALATVIYQTTGKDISTVPGAGAAGGMGGAFLAFLHATLTPGISLLLAMLRFDEKIADADLVITGEGKMDRQTLMGKGPYGILKAAQKQHIPVIGIAGRVEDKAMLIAAGFKEVYAITPEGMPLAQAILPGVAKENIVKEVMRVL